MCGIIITNNKEKLDSIKHRGIEFSYNRINKIFGHHRLPIQTIKNDNWLQPISLNKGILLFNGEIFNYDKNKYNNDVEYLEKLFYNIQFNQDLPKNIIDEINTWDGFWSIVLSDGENLLAFTDPLGKKQLYYNTQTSDISSEVKGIENNSAIDYIFVSSVNKWGYNKDDRTIYKDVKRILPNKIYHFYLPENRIHIINTEYFDWFKNIPTDSVYNLLDKSVKDRLISKKYKVSLLYSGGLDSTIILYFLKKYNINIDLYSINNSSDIDYIKRIEKEWDLNIRYLDVDETQLSKEELLKIYRINDSMIDLGSVIPQYYLFKEIPNKIVLTGDGADELFGGYRRINEYDSQKSDVFEELTFYHLVRIDRMSMHFTIEARNPFLSHDIIKKALNLPFEERKNKKILKDTFRGKIPDYILDRDKTPLKTKSIKENEKLYRRNLIDLYLKYLDPHK